MNTKINDYIKYIRPKLRIVHFDQQSDKHRIFRLQVVRNIKNCRCLLLTNPVKKRFMQDYLVFLSNRDIGTITDKRSDQIQTCEHYTVLAIISTIYTYISSMEEGLKGELPASYITTQIVNIGNCFVSSLDRGRVGIRALRTDNRFLQIFTLLIHCLYNEPRIKERIHLYTLINK